MQNKKIITIKKIFSILFLRILNTIATKKNKKLKHLRITNDHISHDRNFLIQYIYLKMIYFLMKENLKRNFTFLKAFQDHI